MLTLKLTLWMRLEEHLNKFNSQEMRCARFVKDQEWNQERKS